MSNEKVCKKAKEAIDDLLTRILGLVDENAELKQELATKKMDEELNPPSIYLQKEGPPAPKKVRGLNINSGSWTEVGPDTDVALFEAPDVFIKCDDRGFYFEVVTEKGRYRINIDRLGTIFSSPER